MIEDRQSASRTDVGGSFPRYTAATLGFANYWYPVMFARDLGRRPRAITLCGERIVLARDRGRVCTANARPYPVEERAGLIWVYVGEEPAPPVETDVPRELLRPDAVVEGILSRQRGNWRYAAENGIDEGHVRYLHRGSAWTFFREIPAWTRMHMGPSDDGEWLTRIVDEVTWSDNYARVGRWPRLRPWQSRARGALEIGIRLPCWLRVRQRGWTSFEIYVPSDTNHYLSGLLATTHARGLEAVRFRAKYRLWLRWAFHGLFHDQDQWVIEQMQIPPERLYRPDASITAWRRLCEEQARGAPLPTPAAAPPALAAIGGTPESRPADSLV
jgi:phenylpropionate dioxygenase-like ring-hydroxylating dioxygenase large terminal subunit